MLNDPRHCVDCGREIMGKLRCRTCNGAFLRLQAARDLDMEDAELIASTTGLSLDRVAIRLGISKPGAARRLRRARARQRLLHG